MSSWSYQDLEQAFRAVIEVRHRQILDRWTWDDADLRPALDAVERQLEMMDSYMGAHTNGRQVVVSWGNRSERAEAHLDDAGAQRMVDLWKSGELDDK